MMHAHVSSGAGVKGGRALPCEGGRQGPRVPSWPCPASNLAPALALPYQPGASEAPMSGVARASCTHVRRAAHAQDDVA